jgi:hypothetical protein
MRTLAGNSSMSALCHKRTSGEPHSVLRLTLDQAVLLLILVAVNLRTLAAVVLLHTLTLVGPLASLATRVVLVAVAATLHAMATVIAGGTATGEVKGSGGDSYSDRNCY